MKIVYLNQGDKRDVNQVYSKYAVYCRGVHSPVF